MMNDVLRNSIEPVIPPRSDPQQTTGRLILQDVYAGRNMAGVKRGEIKKLLVLETLSKPINYSGKMPPISFGFIILRPKASTKTMISAVLTLMASPTPSLAANTTSPT